VTSGSEKRQRKKLVQIRVSDTELAQLAEAADKAGLTLASYARQLVLAAPPPRQGRRPSADKAELARLVAHLGKIGANLNQIARAGNAGAGVDGVALAEELADLAKARALIRAALGRAPEASP
jgi:hypothetical protein